MRLDWTRGLAIATVTAMAWGCNQAPRPEIDAANTAIERARGSQAPKYAAPSMQKAEQAKVALDHELRSQDQAWFKSYDRSRALALETKDAADRASIEAVAARDAADRTREAKAATAKAATAARAAGSDVNASVQPVKIKDVTPVYPATARAAGVEGTVTVQAVIDTSGNVSGTSVLRSVPMLNQAALDAVKQWQYRPAVVNGKPVRSMVMVNVTFVRS